MKFSTIALIIALALPTLSYAKKLTFSCSYDRYSDDKGNHRANKPFKLTFVVDGDAGKTHVVGNHSKAEVTMIERLEEFDHVSFVEVTGSGALMTTVINKKLESVHSRNTVMFGDIIASQYYGKCTFK